MAIGRFWMISRLKYKEGLIENVELRMENCGSVVLVVANSEFREFNSPFSILNSTLHNGRL